ncbi:efflux RND transporter permease subunit [Maribacter sp. 2307ULW6-5]|uniref:efflux RND transporter permease subunit n=1 Tax=Maribacter sp. 2307ULW6-5 TaxID=3386275 RepID=UPI0039BD6165
MRIISLIIKYKIVAVLLVFVLLFVGFITSPFHSSNDLFSDMKVSVDVIPNLGENQQIVFTEWQGQSPQNIEDQITYPLTTYLLGLPQVKTVRSSSMFGVSSIYVIFKDGTDFYWARARLLEKLTALPRGMLPLGVQPSLGPDATALGQVFWYTLEGRDSLGRVTGGWSLQDTRNIQDFYLKNALASTNGVAEVASIGGYVREYQIDVDPQLMRRYKVSLKEVVKAARESNLDIGAETIEINKMEYFVRGLGQISSLTDLEEAVVKVSNFKPIRIKDVARVTIGPADRRGILDKGGAEVVGGVVTARYGENPLKVIEDLRDKIAVVGKGLPSKKLRNGSTSKLTIVPFYDRGNLIEDTLGTLETTITLEILISIIVVLLLLRSLRVSIIVSSLMPLVVVFTFIMMKVFRVDANIVSLSGIAIAIGTVVDMGIIMTENIIRHLKVKHPDQPLGKTIILAANEVSGAILTAGITTILSFIPVFMLTGAERKLFFPLAFTKTAALTGAILLAVTVVPAIMAIFHYRFPKKRRLSLFIQIILALFGIVGGFLLSSTAFLVLPFATVYLLHSFDVLTTPKRNAINRFLGLSLITLVLAYYWQPLGPTSHFLLNLLFVLFLLALVLVPLYFFLRHYTTLLSWVLENKRKSLVLPVVVVFLGFLAMSNVQKEFMPKLNEGDFILMPTSLPYAGVSEITNTLKQLDRAVATLPEVAFSVGKAGRVNSALDPAPLSMYENLIAIKPEYALDEQGNLMRFKTDGKGGFLTVQGDTVAPGSGVATTTLVPNGDGAYYRNWRKHIKDRQDIWSEITAVTRLPNITTSPQLQPIETRLVMLQTGMRSNLGIKVYGQDLQAMELFSLELEKTLKEIPGVLPNTVFAERIVGKPYLLIEPKRKNIAKFGLSVKDVQETVAIAVGGKTVAETIDGRQRYAVRVRYPRELRGSPSEIGDILIDTPVGSPVPLSQLAEVYYEKGPQSIKGEDGFLVNYVTFDKLDQLSEVEIVNRIGSTLQNKIANNELAVPVGINYEFAGSYKDHLRSERTLSLVIPLVFALILIILYIQFRSVTTSFMVFSGTAVAFAGGFILVWLYGQSWFFDIGLGENTFRDFLNIRTVNLSVAVWIGFIALFGIATDDGVLMATYLDQNFKKGTPKNVHEIRQKVIAAGNKRIRPCLMTTATTILALFPVLMSTGKGSEIMIPMAVPCLGGMLTALVTLFIVPLLYSWRMEAKLSKSIIKEE